PSSDTSSRLRGAAAGREEAGGDAGVAQAARLSSQASTHRCRNIFIGPSYEATMTGDGRPAPPARAVRDADAPTRGAAGASPRRARAPVVAVATPWPIPAASCMPTRPRHYARRPLLACLAA